MIREALQERLIEDQLKNPLFPNHPKKAIEEHKETVKHSSKVNEEEKVAILDDKVELQEPTPTISIKDEIKNVTLVGATLATKVAVDLLSPNGPEKPTKDEEEPELDEPELDEPTKTEETPIKEDKTPTKEEIKQTEEIEEIQTSRN